MRYTTLGRTGLEVSRIAFGTWQLGGEWGTFDADDAVAAIRRARELGVTFFDTAQGYGFGASEELLARGLRPELTGDRDSVVIATKGGIDPGGPRPRNASREYLRAGVESSLRALGVEYIDLYQVHWPDDATPAEETAGALQEMVDEGKIRHVGVSNYDVTQLAAFDAVRPVETLQPPYHLFQRGIEAEVLPYCQAHDIGVLVYSPLASGLLTGTWTAEVSFDDTDWRSKATAFHGEALRGNLAIVDELKRFAADKGVSVAQLSIAWTLARPGVDVAIVGARRPRNIADSLAAAEVSLSADELARIDEITAGAVQFIGASPEGVA
jgi:aryl-alcohol dehydrogenase-like predicted oxidoreductase